MIKLRWFGFFVLGLTILSGVTTTPAKPPVFRLHLLSEPGSLSVFTQKNSGSLYLLSQLSCPLLRWQKSGVQPWGARCQTKGAHQVECTLNPRLKFQDGSPVTAQHYLQSFQNFLNPKKPAPRADLLFDVKNAADVVAGKKPMTELGIQSPAQGRLLFTLQKSPTEFLLTLTNPLLTAVASLETPVRDDWKKFLSCGPYQISDWQASRGITLSPNRKFPLGSADRPDVEFRFISEDSLSVQAYEKGELDFLRRLPTLYLEKWEKSPELHKIDQLRFDYFVLSPQFRDPRLAQALAESIDYDALTKLYHAKPRPGCVGIPESWTQGPLCWDFHPAQAKKLFASMKDDPRLSQLRLYYSKQGGDDHDRTMEFLQDQWKKNLGLDIKIESQENRIYVQNLAAGKFPFFRKGMSPERPSCLAVLENYVTGAPENYLKMASPDFDALVKKMETSGSSQSLAQLCREGISMLKAKTFLIPTGPIFFSILVRPEWTGWSLNDLNQLDLADLHRKR